MTPLQRIAMGLVWLAFYANAGGYDLLPDPVGWALVLWGVHALPLPERGTLLTSAVIAAVVAVALWFPQVKEQLDDAELSLRWAVQLPALAFVFLLCRALTAAAERQDPKDRKVASRFGVGMWAAVIVAALPPIGDAAGSEQFIAAADVGFFLLLVWLIWNLFAAHGREYTKPPAVSGTAGGS